jgi:uncharacterized membrane protein
MNSEIVAVMQMQPWHRGGLFMGMHWLWWLVWLCTLAVIVWAFVRLFTDRSRTHRRVVQEEAAEAVLRRRFAAGEIDEEELARGLRVLREIDGQMGV